MASKLYDELRGMVQAKGPGIGAARPGGPIKNPQNALEPNWVTKPIDKTSFIGKPANTTIGMPGNPDEAITLLGDSTTPISEQKPAGIGAPAQTPDPAKTEENPRLMTAMLKGVEHPGGFGITRIARPGESHTEMNARYDAMEKKAAGIGAPGTQTPGTQTPQLNESNAYLDQISKTINELSNKPKVVTFASGRVAKSWNPQVAIAAQKALGDIVNDAMNRRASYALGIGRQATAEERNDISWQRNQLTKDRNKIEEDKATATSDKQKADIKNRERDLFRKELQLVSPKDIAGNADVGVGLFRAALQGGSIPDEYQGTAALLLKEFNNTYEQILKEHPDWERSPTIRKMAKDRYEKSIANKGMSLDDFLEKPKK